jgi:hypothetical protein
MHYSVRTFIVLCRLGDPGIISAAETYSGSLDINTSLKNTRRSRPSLNDQPFSLCCPVHCWWCWRALPAAIKFFVKSLHCADHHPIRIGDERERLVTASPVMTKSRAPAGGSNHPESGLVKPPRRDTRALSPAGTFGRKSPLRLAAQKRRVRALLVPMHSSPSYFLCKWRV